MSILRGNKTVLSVMTCLFLILCAFFITRQYMYEVDAEDGFPDSAFSTMSKAAADYFNNIGSGVVDSSSANGGAVPGKLGTAGGVMGYTNPYKGEGVTLSYFDVNDENNGSYSYSSLKDCYKQYAYYGYALNQLGLDQTGSNGLPSGVRQMIGVVLSAVFMLCQGINMFWQFVLTILEQANPFYLLKEGSNAHIEKTSMGLGSAEVVTPIETGMDKLAKLFSGYYDSLQNTAVGTTLPLIICVVLFVWLVVKKGQNAGSTFKGLIIRMLFCFAGIPLCFSVYTTALSFVKDFTSDTIQVGNIIVASNFFDFEQFVYGADNGHTINPGNLSWSVCMTGSNGSLPPLKINAKNGLVDGDCVSKVRAYCYTANSSSWSVGTGAGSTNLVPSSQQSFITNSASQLAFDDTGLGNSNSYILDKLLSKNTSSAPTGSSAIPDAVSIRNVLNLLERYAKGTKVGAGAYAAYARTNLYATGNPNIRANTTGGGTSQEGRFSANCAGLFGLSDSWQEFSKDHVADFDINSGGNLSIKIEADKAKEFAGARFSAEIHSFNTDESHGSTGGAIGNIWANGSLIADGSDDTMTISSSSSLSGLSTMAMYNYLSSTFDKDKVSVYSAANNAANLAKVEHYAVNCVGNGIMQVIYAINCIVLLGAFSYIGYGYALAILIGNFQAMFKLIPATLAGVVGSLKGIATVLILVAAMIIEILGTCVLYCLSTELLGVVYDMITIPCATLVTKALSSNGSSGDGAVIGNVAVGVLSIAVIVFFVKNLMYYRYAVCHAITTSAADIINRFVGANGTVPELGKPSTSMGQRLGNLALAAGGIALASDGKGSSLGERLGIASSENSSETGERDSETTGDSSRSDEQGHGVKREGASGSHGSDDNGNINSDREAEQYVKDNKDAVENIGSEKSAGADAKTGDVDTETDKSVSETGTNTTSEEVDKDLSSETSKTTTETGNTSEQDSENRTDNKAITTNNETTSTESEEDSDSTTKSSNKHTENETELDSNVDEQNKFVGGKAGGSSHNYTVTGEDGEQYMMVNSKTGKPYTEEDRANGESYSLVGSGGKPYMDESGRVYANMDSGSLVGGTGNMAIDGGNGQHVSTTSHLVAAQSSGNDNGSVGGQSNGQNNYANYSMASGATAGFIASGYGSGAAAYSGGYGSGGGYGGSPAYQPQSGPAPSYQQGAVYNGGAGGNQSSGNGGNSSNGAPTVIYAQGGGNVGNGAPTVIHDTVQSGVSAVTTGSTVYQSGTSNVSPVVASTTSATPVQTTAPVSPAVTVTNTQASSPVVTAPATAASPVVTVESVGSASGGSQATYVNETVTNTVTGGGSGSSSGDVNITNVSNMETTVDNTLQQDSYSSAFKSDSISVAADSGKHDAPSGKDDNNEDSSINEIAAGFANTLGKVGKAVINEFSRPKKK